MASTEEMFDQGARHYREGRWPQAQQALHAVVAAVPGHFPAWHLLGLIALQSGQYAAAADCFRRAVVAGPHSAELLTLLGTALQNLGRLDEAIAWQRRALAIDPGFGMAMNNLGITLAARGQVDEAIDLFQKARALDPADGGTVSNLAAALRMRGRFDEAAELYEQAIRLSPNLPQPHNNLANVWSVLGRLDDAIAAFRRAVALQPGWSVPHTGLGVALLNQGRLAEARACLHEGMRLAPGNAAAHSAYLALLHYDPAVGGAALLAEHCRWGQLHAGRFRPPPAYTNPPDPQRRLRVGYVSPDFHYHAAAFFVQPVLANHDPAQVEVFCYAEVPLADPITARIRACAHHWCDTPGMTDDELAARIRADGIDILIDLAGHTADNRLLVFARRPAPVQINYLGYPGTTGLPAIPFRLADAVTAPGEPVAPGEELVLLPGVFCCYMTPPAMPIDPMPPSRRAGAVTFGSLHKLDKLNDAVVDLWCRLLREAPASRLLLSRGVLHGPTADYWREQFTRRGIAAERLLLERPEVGGMEHLQTYNRIDVVLDVFPWSGHTTACEALWMGTPVVTLRGDRYAGRMTASVLAALGRHDWIAATPEEYLRIALRLAADEALRAGLRTALRPQLLRSPLCDGRGFTRGLEAAYRRLWQRWCAAQKPPSPGGTTS
jgi:predicted O-linked N-acetylglucosamine transferase (SPINDLY family)